MINPPPEQRRSGFPAYVSAGVLLAAGGAVLPFAQLGALSELMVQHLFTMNVMAPLLGAVLNWRASPLAGRCVLLWTAACVQMPLLWGWHAPSVQQAASGSPVLHVVMLAALAVAATLFWATTLRAAAENRWSGLAALLITGKLACLLGGLMVFAPRELYSLAGLAFSICASGPSTLSDQQLAGLMMIVACPLSYVLAGLIMAAQMLARLELRGAAPVGAMP